MTLAKAEKGEQAIINNVELAEKIARHVWIQTGRRFDLDDMTQAAAFGLVMSYRKHGMINKNYLAREIYDQCYEYIRSLPEANARGLPRYVGADFVEFDVELDRRVANDPADICEQREIIGMFDRLSERDRSIIYMFCVDERGFDEIAETVGVTENSAWRIRRRVTDKIRALL